MKRLLLLTLIISVYSSASIKGQQVYSDLNASTGNEGQYIVDADTNIYMYHGNQLAKLDKNFNPIWVKTYNDLSFYSLLLSKTGSIFFISKNAASSNYANIVGKLNSDGSLSWCKYFQTSYSQNSEYFCQLLLDRNNHLAISGSDNFMTGTVSKKTWFLKLDTLGNMLSSKIIDLDGLQFDKFIVTEDSMGTYRFIGDYFFFEVAGAMVLKYDELLDSITKTGITASAWQPFITFKKFYKSKYDPGVYYSFYHSMHWTNPPHGSITKCRNDSILWSTPFNLPNGPYNIDNFDEDDSGNVFYTLSSSYMNSNSFTNSVHKINATCTSSQTVQYFSYFNSWPPNNTSDITGKVHHLYGNKYFHDVYGSNFLANPLLVTALDSNLNATCTTASISPLPGSNSGGFMMPNTMNDQITNDASVFVDLFPSVTAVTNFSINANYCLTVDTKTIKPNESHFEIYPNPSTNILNVRSENYDIRELIVYDITGKQILSNIDQTSINVSKLSSGIYFIKIKTDQSEFSYKFIKE